MRRLFVTRDDIKHVLHLPLIERLTHKQTRRVVIGISIGITVMIGASTMAVSGHAQTFVPHALWDATAYFLHGAGSIPVVRYIEPMWFMLMGIKEGK